MDNCEICPIIATHNDGADVVVLETDKWRVVLDPNQQYLGKAFVSLLEHKRALADLSSDDWSDFAALVRRLEGALKRSFGVNHFNWSCLMNVAAMKHQSTHVHWHIHPRYDEPVEVAGETFEDTQWYPRKEKTDHVVSRKVLQVIAGKIRQNL